MSDVLLSDCCVGCKLAVYSPREIKPSCFLFLAVLSEHLHLLLCGFVLLCIVVMRPSVVFLETFGDKVG